MGIPSVAVHSTAESDAMHVRMADESDGIGPPVASESTFFPAITLPVKSQARNIHPGYGFSENARFVQIVEDHGLTFIGPSAEHIRIMGDKITAKDTMFLDFPACLGQMAALPHLRMQNVSRQNWLSGNHRACRQWRVYES